MTRVPVSMAKADAWATARATAEHLGTSAAQAMRRGWTSDAVRWARQAAHAKHVADRVEGVRWCPQCGERLNRVAGADGHVAEVAAAADERGYLRRGHTALVERVKPLSVFYACARCEHCEEA